MASASPEKAISTTEALQAKLKSDQEWLKELTENLEKSASLATNITSMLDTFQERLDGLNRNIAPLCEKTSAIQRKRQNIKKLLNIIQATIQFYGKTSEFENAVRDGDPSLNLEDFVDKMDSLKEAIAFFSSHPTYRGQLENMNQIYETACVHLETTFTNMVKSETIPLDPTNVLESLNEEYEIPSLRIPGLVTLKDTRKLSVIAKWLLDNSNSTHFLTSYAAVRSENMMKTLKVINDQYAQHGKQQKQALIKLALKKASGKAGEKAADGTDGKDNILMVVLFMLATLLIAIQLETDAAHVVFDRTKTEAPLLRQTISGPLRAVLDKGSTLTEQYEGNFVDILPLTKFLVKHANQLQSLSENVGEREKFAEFRRLVYQRSSRLLSDFVDKLINDNNRFVPEDGNVHPITSNTVNLLKTLAKSRAIINQVLDETTGERSSKHLGQIFAQILSAIGVNLRNKATIYTDSSLAALFMVNNLSYINKFLREPSLQQVLSDHRLQSYFDAEIEEQLRRYLASWSRVTAVFSSGAQGDRRSAKSYYAAFNKEFDSVIEAQKNFCVSDVAMAHLIRSRIKEAVLRPYVDFRTKNSQEAYALSMDRQIKYDAEALEIIIDRLFDVAY